MNRALQPEILDYLAPHHPAARRSRRDLRVINALMGNDRWLARTLAKETRPGERWLELGAGDGRFAARVGAGRCDGVDLLPPADPWPPAARWYQGDVRDFKHWRGHAVVFANLFFHHLTERALRQVGAELREHARVILASEPLRARRFQWLFAGLCPVIGANDVTRHDGHVSIGAGFRDDELPRSLGLLDDRRWECRVRHTPLGAYRFIAVKS